MVPYALVSPSMKEFTSNRDFYEYLFDIRGSLSKRGSAELSAMLDAACRQASSASTEFLGESRFALRHLLSHEDGILTVEERADLIRALEQLDSVLGR